MKIDSGEEMAREEDERVTRLGRLLRAIALAMLSLLNNELIVGPEFSGVFRGAGGLAIRFI